MLSEIRSFARCDVAASASFPIIEGPHLTRQSCEAEAEDVRSIPPQPSILTGGCLLGGNFNFLVIRLDPAIISRSSITQSAGSCFLS